MQAAEAQKRIVIVPIILKVAEVEVEITIRVSNHIRHPVIAAGTRPRAMYGAPSMPPRRAPALLCILFRAICPLARCTDLLDFFI